MSLNSEMKKTSEERRCLLCSAPVHTNSTGALHAKHLLCYREEILHENWGAEFTGQIKDSSGTAVMTYLMTTYSIKRLGGGGTFLGGAVKLNPNMDLDPSLSFVSSQFQVYINGRHQQNIEFDKGTMSTTKELRRFACEGERNATKMKVIWTLTLVNEEVSKDDYYCQKTSLKTDVAFEPLDREEYAKLYDVTLKVGQSSVPCHKIQLARRSKVFAAMFNHDVAENTNGEVQIEDFDLETVQDFVHFLYNGKLEGDYNLDTLAIANKYDVGILKEICEAELSKGLSGSNVIACWIASDMCQAAHLKKAVLAYIVENWAEKEAFEGYADIFKHHPELLVELLTLKK